MGIQIANASSMPAVPYEIIVRVTYKGKTWEERKTISALMARSLEKVIASFKRVSVKTIEVLGTLNTILKKSIEVFARRK